jgi:hypothetical protein
MFLMQTLLGGATEHYRAEISNFFGFDLARILLFNIARTWHLQLSLFVVSTSFLAAGIFLVPLIAGKEPRRQHWLSYGLLSALAIVVFGSLAGEYAGIRGWMMELAMNNEIDRFSLAIDAIDRVPKLQEIGGHAKEKFRNRQIACRAHAYQYGIDSPDITNWRWPAAK